MKRMILLAPLALTAAACSQTEHQDDRRDPSARTTAAAEVRTATASTPASSAAGAPGDAGAVAATVKRWDLTGPCELMTDEFLHSQTFVSDRALACKTFRSGWQPKQYRASDIIISDVTVAGDTAQATLGSNLADLTVRFSLVRDGARWQIDSARTR